VTFLSKIFFSSKDAKINYSLQLFKRKICSKIKSFNHKSLRKSSQNVKGLTRTFVAQIWQTLSLSFKLLFKFQEIEIFVNNSKISNYLLLKYFKNTLYYLCVMQCMGWPTGFKWPWSSGICVEILNL
jgi:hypothetical protein